MIQGKAPPASSNAFPGNRVGSAPSLSQSHQLVSRQRQDTEHQMSHDFGGTLNPEGVATEFALESRIAALGHGALVETDRISRLEFFFRAAAWIMVNQRHMIQASAMLVQHGAAIGSIHHIVKTGDAGSADQGEGNRRTAIVHRGGREQGRDGDATIRGIDMQLVAVPAHFIALRIALGATIAARRHVRQHLRQCLLALALKRRQPGWRTDFSPRRAAPLLSGPCRRGRGFTGGFGVLASGRTFARMDRRAVTTQMADQLTAKVRLDQGFMRPFGQSARGEFGKGARERRFGRDLFAQRKSADAPQGTINRQALNQAPRRVQPENRLGDKGIGQPGAFAGRTSDTAPRRGHEFLNPYPFERMNHPLKFGCQGAHVVAQFRKQFMLNDVPALHDQVAFGSIHGRAL